MKRDLGGFDVTLTPRYIAGRRWAMGGLAAAILYCSTILFSPLPPEPPPAVAPAPPACALLAEPPLSCVVAKPLPVEPAPWPDKVSEAATAVVTAPIVQRTALGGFVAMLLAALAALFWLGRSRLLRVRAAEIRLGGRSIERWSLEGARLMPGPRLVLETADGTWSSPPLALPSWELEALVARIDALAPAQDEAEAEVEASKEAKDRLRELATKARKKASHHDRQPDARG